MHLRFCTAWSNGIGCECTCGHAENSSSSWSVIIFIIHNKCIGTQRQMQQQSGKDGTTAKYGIYLDHKRCFEIVFRLANIPFGHFICAAIVGEAKGAHHRKDEVFFFILLNHHQRQTTKIARRIDFRNVYVSEWVVVWLRICNRFKCRNKQFIIKCYISN